MQWVPNQYWPAHSHVSVGVQELTTGFDTGDAFLGVASISGHTFTVSRDGEILRTMPASMGKPSRPTPIGNFTALEKQRSVVMDSRTIGIPLSSPEGYKITAQYAVRVTCTAFTCTRHLGRSTRRATRRQPRMRQPESGQRGVVLQQRQRRRPHPGRGVTVPG